MKIAVGTVNKAKMDSVHKAVAEYPIWQNAEIIGVKVGSDVADQPIGLEETIRGAQNRARKALLETGADWGIGLESGIFPVPQTKSEYMDTTACAIYDGTNFHLGLSSCFEYPRALIEKVFKEGMDISQAALATGFSDNPQIGSQNGMIGVLTKDRVTRLDYTYQAVQMALIHLENKGHY